MTQQPFKKQELWLKLMIAEPLAMMIAVIEYYRKQETVLPEFHHHQSASQPVNDLWCVPKRRN